MERILGKFNLLDLPHTILLDIIRRCRGSMLRVLTLCKTISGFSRDPVVLAGLVPQFNRDRAQGLDNDGRVRPYRYMHHHPQKISTLTQDERVQFYAALVDIHGFADSSVIGVFNPVLLQQLIVKGANIHARDEEALKQACRQSKVDIVRILLENGANASESDNAALLFAADGGEDCPEIATLLINAGADVHARNDIALRTSCRRHPNFARALIEAHANVHVLDDIPLRTAARYGHVELVTTLVVAGANIDANECDALRIASELGWFHVVQKLLELGGSLNEGAFTKALAKGHTNIVGLLIDAGIDVYEEDLITAIRREYVDIVRLLVDHVDIKECIDVALQNANRISNTMKRNRIVDILNDRM